MPGTAEELRGKRGCERWSKVSRVPLGVFSFVVETRAKTGKHVTQRVLHAAENEIGKLIGKRGIEWNGHSG